MKKRVIILGSTGSIGTQALKIIKENPNDYELVGICAGKNQQLLAEQVAFYKPAVSGLAADATKIASHGADIVLNAIVGFAGLAPTVAALQSGADVALANKESLVSGGDLVMGLARQYGKKILPVDSEHSAIWQCLGFGSRREQLKNITITASGGPFRQLDKADFDKITVKQALNHPNWVMGAKITIDSATLMNKGLEVIEAMHLFDLPKEQVKVLVHPQSIVHGMVSFLDNSTIMQAGVPSMEIPISLALAYPNILKTQVSEVDFASVGRLDFFEADLEKFECLKIALDVASVGGVAPLIMNAANEVAVERFLSGGIKFNEISYLLKKALDKFGSNSAKTLDEITELDANVRAFV